MINIDDRFLEKVNENELWLMVHITKRLNKEMFCFPSNTTLLTDTGWGIDKLQKVKKALVNKGFLAIRSRYFGEHQTSNEYYVTTDFIGCYVGADRMSPPPSENSTYPHGFSSMGGVSENQTTKEVLTNSEVLIHESKDSSQNSLFQHSTPEADKPSKKPTKKGAREKVVDECYTGFVKIWCEAYPELQFDAISGKAIQRMITKVRNHMIGKSQVPTKEGVENNFAYIIAYIKRERHWCHGKPATTVDSQLTSVIFEITNGKQQKSTPANSARDYINNLR